MAISIELVDIKYINIFSMNENERLDYLVQVLSIVCAFYSYLKKGKTSSIIWGKLLGNDKCSSFISSLCFPFRNILLHVYLLKYSIHINNREKIDDCKYNRRSFLVPNMFLFFVSVISELYGIWHPIYLFLASAIDFFIYLFIHLHNI